MVSARVRSFESVLQSDPVDLLALRRLCFEGVPDESRLRPLCWRLLLGYLPPERHLWAAALGDKREEYAHFRRTFLSPPPAGSEDHPLSSAPASQWHAYFKDNDVLLQIDKDARRLCPDMAFFRAAAGPRPPQPPLHERVRGDALHATVVRRKRLGANSLEPASARPPSPTAASPTDELHWEVVERMLFLFAKLNPGQGYVQGMSELIAPLYHAFATDPSPEWRRHAEPDCFYCFVALMAELRDRFIKGLDRSQEGALALLDRFHARVRSTLPKLWTHLAEQNLLPQYYAFRWLTLLLAREFALPDVARLWDSLLADDHRFEFLHPVCTAMLQLVQDDLLKGDFAANVKLLQNYPVTDVDLVLATAAKHASDNY